MSNFPPGYDWHLRQIERSQLAYEWAEERAWERLADEAPDGVGWSMDCCGFTSQGAYEFVAADGGGHELTIFVSPPCDNDVDWEG